MKIITRKNENEENKSKLWWLILISYFFYTKAIDLNFIETNNNYVKDDDV
jgi:hypothetical protein